MAPIWHSKPREAAGDEDAPDETGADDEVVDLNEDESPDTGGGEHDHAHEEVAS